MDFLTSGQIELLKTIKPLSEWEHELNIYDYDSDRGWNMIEEEFWQYNKPITYDDFKYAGRDMTIINNDLILINKLKDLENEIKYRIVNSHYHNIARRIILDYQINDLTYNNALENLTSIRNLIYVSKYDQIVKIQRLFRWVKKLPILWKIAEYYSAKKYKPENILKYIKLD